MTTDIDLWAGTGEYSGAEMRLLTAIAAQHHITIHRAKTLLTTLRNIESRKRRKAGGRQHW